MGFSEYQREREIADLRELVPLVRQASLKSARPTWLCLAVTKVDLYHATLLEAQEYYAQGSESPFAILLNSLQHHLGRLRFKWFAAPVCASLEPFEWNGDVVDSQGVSQSQRNRIVADLLTRIAGECSHG